MSHKASFSSPIQRNCYWLFFTLLVLLSLLSACQMHPRFHQHSHHQSDTFYTHWDIEGKIGIQSQAESISASLSWSQRAKSFQIELIGPLGQGRAFITGDPEQVSMTLPDGSQTNSKTADALLEKITGVKVPVQAMLWWIQGLPVPNTKVQHSHSSHDKSTPNHLAFDQLGWHVQYPQFHSTGQKLPRKIVLSSQQHKVKVFIRSWKVLK